MSNKILITILIIALAIFVSATIFLGNNNLNLRDKNNIYQELNSIQSKLADLTELSDKALAYYDEASIEYDYNNYDKSISRCQLSRDTISIYNQKLREVKAGIERKEKIFDLYKNLIDENIIIYNSLYEACEYFESANRQYDANDYTNGGENIDLMNEKIRAHDRAVERYNSILAEITTEMQKL